MTRSKIQQFQRRLDKLTKLYPVTPTPSREDLIVEMALGLMQDEHLWIQHKMEDAGRSIPSNEQEFEALAAWDLAVEKAIHVIDTSSEEEIQRLIDGFGKPPTPRSD